MSLLIGVNDVWHELGGCHNGVSAEKFEKTYNMLITELTIREKSKFSSVL
ncbi:MAG: hypothetical protein IKK03_04325 [Lachnospiraceae bacterium]|nr:hypothetical protein [Lachnospiraceae bacterium]